MESGGSFRGHGFNHAHHRANLALDGAQMEMMRAVLDRIFWLARTSSRDDQGYATSSVAGL